MPATPTYNEKPAAATIRDGFYLVLTTLSPTPGKDGDHGSYRIAPCSSSDKHSRANAAPVNFDPVTHPIIAAHYFGVGPLRPIDHIHLRRLRSHRKVLRIHKP